MRSSIAWFVWLVGCMDRRSARPVLSSPAGRLLTDAPIPQSQRAHRPPTPSSSTQGTFEGFEKFIKENRDLKDSHTYRFGAIDGELLDTAGVEKVSQCVRFWRRLNWFVDGLLCCVDGLRYVTDTTRTNIPL